MEVKEFNTIIKTIESLTEQCEKTIGHIKSKDDLDNMSLKQLRETVAQCRCIYGQMDKINTTELYHIIGMGKLSGAQRNKFWSKMETFLSYRPDLHNICNLNIPETPGIPAQSSYKLKVLGNITLTNSKEE